MDFEIIFEGFNSIAGFIISVSTIIGAFITVYKYAIAKPKENREAKRQKEENEKTRKTISEQTKPILDTLERLNKSIEKQELRDEELNKIASRNTGILEKHNERLDNHSLRLVVLETKTGVPINLGENMGSDNENEVN